MPNTEPLVFLYDNDCGFCRWSTALLLRRAPRGSVSVHPIQSAKGEALLAAIPSDRRLLSAWALSGDSLLSGSDAVLAVLDIGRDNKVLAQFVSRCRPFIYRSYLLIANHRHIFGRLVSRSARQRADSYLADYSNSDANNSPAQ
jgi:predicted DCC family thiol-disulfide oxidoreductase YuxK